MAEIKTEKQTIEAIDNGMEPWEIVRIPDEFRKLESVILAAVKRDGYYLQFADVQIFEICLAAVQNAGHHVLGFVDKELRNVALLEICGINVEQYDRLEQFTYAARGTPTRFLPLKKSLDGV